MFALVKGVYGEITKREEYFISILGLDNAGKSVCLSFNNLDFLCLCRYIWRDLRGCWIKHTKNGIYPKFRVQLD
jgi:hypothetical protein